MEQTSQGFIGLAPLNARVRQANDRPVSTSGDYVLYWMLATRRPRSNFALDRAIAYADALKRPLVVPSKLLQCDYPWASDRLHRFVIEGMAANRAAFASLHRITRTWSHTSVPAEDY